MIEQLKALSTTWGFWYKVIELLIALGGVIATLWVAYIASRLSDKIWKKQKETERNLQIEANKYQKYLEAHAAAWQLLAYLTKAENSKNIVLYKGTAQSPEYYFITKNAKEFIENLSKIFYEQGHGLFLSTETKDKLFHARAIVFGFLLRMQTEKNTESEVLIQNNKFATSIEEIHEELRVNLRDVAASNVIAKAHN